MQNICDIEQGVPEIRGFKWLEMILLRETKKREKYYCETFWADRLLTLGMLKQGF